MTDPVLIVARLLDAGADVTRQGDRLILRAGEKPVPAEVVALVRRHKRLLLDLLFEDPMAPETDEREERAAIIEYDGGLPREWAERLAAWYSARSRARADWAA